MLVFCSPTHSLPTLNGDIVHIQRYFDGQLIAGECCNKTVKVAPGDNDKTALSTGNNLYLNLSDNHIFIDFFPGDGSGGLYNPTGNSCNCSGTHEIIISDINWSGDTSATITNTNVYTNFPSFNNSLVSFGDHYVKINIYPLLWFGSNKYTAIIELSNNSPSSPFNVHTTPLANGENDFSSNIRISSTNSEEATYQHIKENNCIYANQYSEISDGIKTIVPLDEQTIENSSNNRKVDMVSNIQKAVKSAFTSIRDGSRSVFDYFSIGAKTNLTGGAKIFQQQCNDPPAYDYFDLAEASGEMLDFELQLNFGADYAVLDNALMALGQGIENYERLLITIERLQGAMIDNNEQAIALQRSYASSILSDIEDSFTRSHELLLAADEALTPYDPSFHTILDQLESATKDVTASNLIQRSLLSTPSIDISEPNLIWLLFTALPIIIYQRASK